MSKLNLIPMKDVLKEIAKDLSELPSMDYPEEFNPFQPALNKIRLSEYENLKLSELLERVILAKNIDELNKIVDEALDFGIRVNARNKDGFSLSNVTIFKMSRDKFTGKSIIRKLAINGADFDELGDEKTIEICKKVQKEVEPQVYNRLKKLRKIGENAATEGTVKEVEFDNKTFYIEFSQNSRVDVAKVVEGAKSLGLSKGDLKIGGNIIKIGNGEVELKTGENGERDYTDVSDSSAFSVTFHTNLGELNVKVWHNPEQYNQIQVEVENKEIWDELQKIGETVGQNCLFGGMSVKAAIEQRCFMRSGRCTKSTEIIRHNKPQNSELISWVDRTKGDKTVSIARS